MWYYIIYNGDWIAITKETNIFIDWLLNYDQCGIVKLKDTQDFTMDLPTSKYKYTKLSRVSL